MSADSHNSKSYWGRLLIAVGAAEIVLWIFYREVTALRHYSPIVALAMAVGLGLAVYVGFELVRMRCRMNLKLAFAVMTIVGIGLAILSKQVSIAVQQRQLVEVVSQLGGVVYYDNHGSNDPFWLSTRSGWILPKWLIAICGQDLFQDIWTVTLADITDRQVRDTSFAALEQLESLSVNGAALSKQATEQLADKLQHMGRLEDLQVYQAEISREFIASLQKLPKLRTLILNDCDFEPESIAQIQQLHALEFFRMDRYDPQLDELKALASHPTLKTIALYDNSLTSQELLEFELALPGCEIWHRFSESAE